MIDTNTIFKIYNLILEKGKTSARSGCVDIYGCNNCEFTATNCIFRNNEGFSGGAVFVYGYNKFIAEECLFTKNKAVAGSAVFLYVNAIFIAENCVFLMNEYNIWFSTSDVIGIVNSVFEAKNCVFDEGNTGSTISIQSDYLTKNTKIYLYHCTFDRTSTMLDSGNSSAMFIYKVEDGIYSYNNIYTGYIDLIVDTTIKGGEGKGTITDGKNLIEGINCTREEVFGDNEFKDGYIMPLKFAKSAERLTAVDIEVPDGVEKDSIINFLAKDMIGQERPDKGFVTYGAVENDYIEILYDDVLVTPNPTNKEFEIIFYNTKEQKITIELFDLAGKKSLDIFNGLAEAGKQIYKVDTKLSSGTYYIKVLVDGRLIVRKLIIEK